MIENCARFGRLKTWRRDVEGIFAGWKEGRGRPFLHWKGVSVDSE